MRNNHFFKALLATLSVVFFVSCDKDYNVVGEGLIGENHFDLLKKDDFKVTAYNQKTDFVQSNNLPINALGIYTNALGTTTASFATQVELAAVDPTIATTAEIGDVYLDIPYFVDATQTKVNEKGGNTYVLDSIYGEKLAKIKLSVFESGFTIRDKDPATDLVESQKYYNNQNSDFDADKKGTRLNNDVVAQNDEFFFDPTQRTITTIDAAGVKTITYAAPSMRLKLDATFFKEKILKAPAGQLATNNVFQEYFKGLYFKVEKSGTDAGSLAMLNFGKGTITINYKEDVVVGTATSKVDKTIVLNLTGNTVSLLEKSNPNADYTTAINAPDRTDGDEKIYLKGGEGSLAIVTLFGEDKFGEDGVTGIPNTIADDLDKIRHNKWLINQASLVFTIDATTMASSHEPERLYLYDYDNNTTVMDYYIGASTNNKNTSKNAFGGKITRDATTLKRGVSYKINLTNHIRNLVKNTDAKNIKLGVIITEDINVADFYKVKTPTDFITYVPQASVLNPLGTILYGGKSTVAKDKRLKLEIYYTKPN